MFGSGSASARARSWQYLLLGGLSLVMVVSVVAAFRNTYGDRPVSAVPGRDQTNDPAAGVPDLRPLELPEEPRVMVLGDSWSEGVASAPGKGFMALLAEELGWQVTAVPNGSGSGWQYPGEQRAGGRPGTFAQRLAKQPRDPAIDLVFMQGGLNDQQLAADGGSLTTAFNDRVSDTIALAHLRYPRAKIVIMGPLMPVANFEGIVPEIDDRLSLEAAQGRCYYISPHLEGWMDSAAKIRRYVDASADNHLNTAGHAFLAQRTAAALRKLMKRGQSLEMPAG